MSRHRTIKIAALASLLALITACCPGCEPPQPPASSQPKSASGVAQARADVKTDPTTGLTVEQSNVKKRLENDNKPGAIKHLYVISPFTGDVLIYSAVQGKVTSGGKRLTPTQVAAGHASWGNYSSEYYGSHVNIGGRSYVTPEVIQDDGTYGSSGDYIYWWDTKGIYRQVGTAGCLWIVSDQPLQVSPAIITFDSLDK